MAAATIQSKLFYFTTVFTTDVRHQQRREDSRGHALSFCENAIRCAIFALDRER